jgi:sec-independent protein translocase protein TatB
MNVGWSELMVVGIVALVLIGPKELPGMFREFGRFMAKMRAMGRDFSRAMEMAAKESGVQDVADDLKKMTSPKAMGLDAVKSAADRFEKWDPMKNTIKPPTLQPNPSPQSAPVAATTPVAPPAPPGPETAALAEKVAARKAVAAEAAAKIRAINTGVVTEAPSAAAPQKRPGRVRKKAEKTNGETS